jgi:hypothetical protein
MRKKVWIIPQEISFILAANKCDFLKMKKVDRMSFTNIYSADARKYRRASMKPPSILWPSIMADDSDDDDIGIASDDI